MKVKSNKAKFLCEMMGVNRVAIQGCTLFGEEAGIHIYTSDGYYEHLTEEEYFKLKSE